LWDSSLRVKAIKGILNKGIIKNFKPSRNIPGKGFIIVNYSKPVPRFPRKS
jgi:hypothetical protein